jgi:hypothetical protein
MRIPLLSVFLLMLSLNSLVWAESPKGSDPAGQTQATPAAKSEALPTPLPAEQFKGRAREAYQAAADLPDVFTQISCYCGCDKSRGHRYLLDCFTDEHGAECNHCMSEALDASAMFKSGVPPEEIRQFIDQKYGQKH